MDAGYFFTEENSDADLLKYMTSSYKNKDMPNTRKTSIDCTHLLNFKTSIPSDTVSSSSTSSSRRNYKNKHKQRKHDPKKQAAEREEKWTRQKLQSSFFLHSSASHSFVLARSPSKLHHQQQQQQRGNGNGNNCSHNTSLPSEKPRYLRLHGLTQQNSSNDADAVVDWDAVRIVKVQVPTTSYAHKDYVDAAISTCTICLDSFAAPRITKCGHVYCYSCILRHFHVSDNDNSMKKLLAASTSAVTGSMNHRHRESIAKCPCCFNFIQLSEMKPVQFVTVQSPFRSSSNGSSGNGATAKNVSMTFRKCHRKKGGLVPYLPFQTDTETNSGSPSKSAGDNDTVSIRKRVEANDIPSIKANDAPYCRFNYIDVTTYIQHLQNDLSSLQSEMESIIQMYKNLNIGMGNSATTQASSKIANNGNLDRYFVSMALEAVKGEHDAAVACSEEQLSLMNEQESRYANLNKVKVTPFQMNTVIQVKNDKSANTTSVMNKDRSNSVCSVDSSESTKQKKKNNHRPRSNSMHLVPGTTYLDKDHVQFYQAVDGQLCFLCGFNLKCLAYEFMDKGPAKKITSGESKCELDSNNESIQIRPPFPDVIHGQIIDVQTVHLTSEVRKRMPFTSHLPLYVDINLVELNLTQYLSPKTRDHFRGELEQRKKKRQAQRNSERKAKKKAQREEYERIEKLKEGMQSIDVNDEFFRAVLPETQQLQEEEVLVGEAFGPSISSTTASSSSQTISTSTPKLPEVSYANTIQRSYGSVCASNGFFPQVDASNDSAFPSLGASAFPSLSTPSGTPVKAKNDSSQLSKIMKTQSPWVAKSKKKDKVVLFSTGGRRGYA